jgi:hypothetical protein
MNIHSLYSFIFKYWRKRRFDRFLNTFHPGEQDSLIDVGGTITSWLQTPVPFRRVVLANSTRYRYDMDYPKNNFIVIQADGCHMPIQDRAFNIGFSNSVIEHVGTWKRQEKFASEIRRTSIGFWLQTPAFECPIEPHYLAFFIHWFPQNIQKKLLPWFSLRAWLSGSFRKDLDEMIGSIRLLRKKEIHKLFPDCEIYIEKIAFIIPKSYIVFHK